MQFLGRGLFRRLAGSFEVGETSRYPSVARRHPHDVCAARVPLCRLGAVRQGLFRKSSTSAPVAQAKVASLTTAFETVFALKVFECDACIPRSGGERTSGGCTFCRRCEEWVPREDTHTPIRRRERRPDPCPSPGVHIARISERISFFSVPWHAYVWYRTCERRDTFYGLFRKI